MLKYYIAFIYFGAFLLTVEPLEKYIDGRSNVVALNWSNFEELVTQSDDYWLIQFHETQNTPEKMFVCEFEKVAVALKGLVKVGEVHINSNVNLAKRFGFTTIKRENSLFIVFGVDKTQHEKYYGTRSPRHLVDFMFTTVKRRANWVIFDEEPKPKSVDLTGDMYFDILQSSVPWVIAFLHTHCDVATGVYDWWDQMAVSLHGRAKIGHFDLQSDDQGVRYMHRLHRIDLKMEIKSYPKGSKTDKRIQTYHGNLTFENVLDWALDIVDEPTDITQITSEVVYKEYCQMRVCIIFILPNITVCSILCRHDQLKKLSHIASTFEVQHWSWLWAEGGEQLHLEQVLGISTGRYPSMVAVNNFKRTYTHLKGSFFSGDIQDFLKELPNRNTIFTPFYKEMSIIPVAKWLPFEHDEL